MEKWRMRFALLILLTLGGSPVSAQPVPARPTFAPTSFWDKPIPKDAPHPQNALLFINYILRPQVHAALTNKVFYANPNKASLKYVNKDVAGNPSVFLKPEDLARMTVPDTLPQDIKRVQTRTFTEFKTGL